MSETPHLPTFFGRITAAFDGHVELRESARVLRLYCRRRTEYAPEMEADVPPAFPLFVAQVVAHFALEEKESYFGVLTSDVPDLVEHVTRLTAEHRAMEAELQSLAAAADLRPLPTSFPAELARFIDRFESHERDESAVLETFFLR